MAGILSIKPEDEKRLHTEALKWFNARRAEIQFEVPLEELSDDDLNTFLSDDERPEFQSCMKEITKGLATCNNIGDGGPLVDVDLGFSQFVDNLFRSEGFSDHLFPLFIVLLD